MRQPLPTLPAALVLVLALAACVNYPAVAAAPGGGGSGGGSGGTGGAGGGSGGTGGGSGGTGGGSAGSGGSSALPCAERNPEGCSADGACRWLTPGCGEPALESAGCFPAQDCTADAPCPRGLVCQPRVIDPCGNSGCAACGSEVRVCAPPGAACAGAFLDDTGTCRAPDDGLAPVECCIPYDCDPSHVRCRALPPTCQPGNVATINATGCWGPCVPGGFCAALPAPEQLCADTNGAWNPLGCGHLHCGVPIDCNASTPGCDCGPGRSFDPAAGCFQDPSCQGGDDRGLCEGTGGVWLTQSCGHWWCGQTPTCEALIPGCNCLAGSSFVQGQGCLRDPSCSGGGVGEPCGGPDGAPCQAGLVCDTSADPGFPGVCVEPNPGACLSDADCADGTICCYPCGREGCTNRCIAPDSTGGCPMLP